MSNKGICIGVGVGPGDPELLTLKAVRLIEENKVIAVPGLVPQESIAYKIAVQGVPQLAQKQLLGLNMPMTKDPIVLQANHRLAAEKIKVFLDQGSNVIVLSLGDICIYSTFLYIQRILEEDGYETKMVNGIPSFCSAAAALNIGLVEQQEQLHIIPASYEVAKSKVLKGTKVYMKSGRKSMELLEEGRKLQLVENCGMPNQQVYKDQEKIPEQSGYYSLYISKQSEEEK